MEQRLLIPSVSLFLFSVLGGCGTYTFETTSTERLNSYLESNNIKLTSNSYRMHREHSVPVLTTLETLPSIMLFAEDGCRIPKKITCSTIDSNTDISSFFTSENNTFQVSDCEGINDFEYYSKQFLEFNTLFNANITPNPSSNKIIVLWAAMNKGAYKEDLKNLVETLKEEDELDVFYVNLDWTPLR